MKRLKENIELNSFLDDLMSRLECGDCGELPAPVTVQTLNGSYSLKRYLRDHIQMKAPKKSWLDDFIKEAKIFQIPVKEMNVGDLVIAADGSAASIVTKNHKRKYLQKIKFKKRKND